MNYKDMVAALNNIIVKHGHEADFESLNALEIVDRELEFSKEVRALLLEFDLNFFELESTLKRAKENDEKLGEIEDAVQDSDQEIRKLENLEAFRPSDYQKGALHMAAFLRGGGGTLSDKIRMGVVHVR